MMMSEADAVNSDTTLHRLVKIAVEIITSWLYAQQRDKSAETVKRRGILLKSAMVLLFNRNQFVTSDHQLNHPHMMMVIIASTVRSIHLVTLVIAAVHGKQTCFLAITEKWLWQILVQALILCQSGISAAYLSHTK
jgi:hypothetical protein